MARKAGKKAKEQSAGQSLAREIRQCIDTGKVEFGANRCAKKALLGSAKLVILSSNCPKARAQDVMRFCKLSGTPAIAYEGTSMELGTAAGRPHPVSMLAVFDAGNSKILEFLS